MTMRSREEPTVQDWLTYMLNEVSELAAEYPVQMSTIEPFARWNLPDELGESWIAVRDMGIISNLERSSILPGESIATMQKIVDRFEDAFDLPADHRDHIFSHEALQEDDFWVIQRQLARSLLPILQDTLRETREK